jgi:signal transduction histidine kinase
MKPVVRIAVAALGLAVALASGAALDGCARGGDRAWQKAAELWQRRDPAAFAAWRALDATTPDRARAHARLAEADGEYRRGIALLSDGDAGARTLLEAAAARAPLDPALYLSLARACHRRGLDERAAAMYQKFLAQAPAGAEAETARRELGALSDDIGASFEPPRAAPPSWPWWPLLPLGVAVVVGGWLLARSRGRRTSLAELASDHPELQPAIAFLVGCLRHELLKHRILAVGDAVRAVADGQLAKSERSFLVKRLYGGEPLAVAWAGHLGAFMRALGPRFDLLRRDPAFADASRAIDVIAGSEGELARGDSEAARRVLAEHKRLVGFDAALGQLSARLMHTIVDAAFLAQLADDVQRELGPARVRVELSAPAQPIAVESYRFDLALIIRNVLRNAVAAAANGPEPARVALDVEVALEPTGDEVVRVRVRDTNPSPLPAPAELIEARGLALIRAALQRCDGSLSVEPGGDGFAKGVVVRLFCALHAASTEAA